jgi:hypothetical protein
MIEQGSMKDLVIATIMAFVLLLWGVVESGFNPVRVVIFLVFLISAVIICGHCLYKKSKNRANINTN